jgi:hypothetical protein
MLVEDRVSTLVSEWIRSPQFIRVKETRMFTELKRYSWLLTAVVAVVTSTAAGVQAQANQPATLTASASCPLSPGAPALSALPPPPDPKALPQQLATALNLPLATVQQALAAQETQASALVPAPQDPMAGAATQLGVSEQQLVAAVQSADQAMGPAFALPGGPPAGPSGGNQFFVTGGGAGAGGPVLFQGTAGAGSPAGQGGPVMISVACNNPGGGPQVDPSAFFADVAQQLGPAFTGSQVQAAFQASAPAPPDPSTMKSLMQQQSSSLAAALGVSVDALTSALSSIGYPAGCLPLLAGNLSVKPPVSPAGLGDGKPIFVPIGGPGAGAAIFALSGGPAGAGSSGPVVSGPTSPAGGVVCAIPGTAGAMTPAGS